MTGSCIAVFRRSAFVSCGEGARLGIMLKCMMQEPCEDQGLAHPYDPLSHSRARSRRERLSSIRTPARQEAPCSEISFSSLSTFRHGV